MKEIHTFDYRMNKQAMKPNRIAVRSVILKGKSLFLVYLNVTDEFKFPGGSLEGSESFEDTVIRETKEESGAKVTRIKQCLGYIDQIYPDKYNKNKIIYLRNIYFLCDISDKIGQQNLSNSESRLEFQPKWVTINEAIEVNEKRLLLGTKYH